MHSRKSLLTQSIRAAQSWVQRCSFVALDFEMTGIKALPSHESTSLDSIQNRYAKTKMSAEQYFPIQLGLCGIEAVKTAGGVYDKENCILHPMMVPLFPVVTPTLPGRFAMCSSTLQFLSSHSLDFKDIMQNGIAPISEQDHQLIQHRTELRAARKRSYLEDRLKTVEFTAFMQINSEVINTAIERVLSTKQSQSVEIPFQHTKGFIVGALEYQLTQQYPDLGFSLKFDSESIALRSKLIVNVLTSEDAASHRAELAKTAFDTPDDEMFQSDLRKLFQIMCDNKTPLVLHNGLSDIVFLYRIFFGEPPLHELDFKRKVLEYFPTIYDTKFLMKNYGFLAAKGRKKGGSASTALQDSFSAALMFSETKPVVKLGDQSEYQLSVSELSELAHDAGYDALATGYVFVKSLESLNMFDMALNDQQNFKAKSQAFTNKLSIHNSNQVFDLLDQNSTPQMGTVFECVANSKSATPVQIKDWLESKFGDTSVVHYLHSPTNQTRFYFKLRSPKDTQSLDKMLAKQSQYLLFTEIPLKAQISILKFHEKSLLKTNLIPTEGLKPTPDSGNSDSLH